MNQQIKSNAPAIVVVGKAKQGESPTPGTSPGDNDADSGEIVLGTPEDAPRVTLTLPEVPPGLEPGKPMEGEFKFVINSISGKDVEISLLSFTPGDDEAEAPESSEDQLNKNFDAEIPGEG